MNTKEVKNVVASVLARLRNTSKSNAVPFQQVLQQYAMERFLYRVSKSRHAQSVILKGALLLKTIGILNARPTMDIDMLRKGKADQASLVALIKDCATLEVEADGLTFLDNTVAAEEITKDSEYKGARILMDARMDNVRLRLQIDFGVGDVIVPGPEMIDRLPSDDRDSLPTNVSLSSLRRALFGYYRSTPRRRDLLSWNQTGLSRGAKHLRRSCVPASVRLNEIARQSAPQWNE
jgi:hypothetical protein